MPISSIFGLFLLILFIVINYFEYLSSVTAFNQ